MSARFSATIPLSTPTTDVLKNGSEHAGNLLAKEIEESPGKILSLLRSYEKLKPNGGQIYSFVIMSDMFIDASGSGTFMVKYPVRMSYGCRELNEWIDDTMQLSVQVDFATNSATVTGIEAFVPNGKNFES